jgi:hypothetical protein
MSSWKPPDGFSTLRAAFWLLAVVVVTELIVTIEAVSVCAWMVLTQATKLGDCGNVGVQVREVWAEMLAAILALLLASRNGAPPPPPPPP